MSDADCHRELRCAGCGWSDFCDVARMRHWLQRAGMLRRASDPEPQLIVELFGTVTKKLACPDCDGALTVEVPDDREVWAATRPCEGCGGQIPPARLAAMPGTRFCAACQEKRDRGEPLGEAEYCPHCGGLLVMRRATSGVTRYVMRCRDCGR